MDHILSGDVSRAIAGFNSDGHCYRWDWTLVPFKRMVDELEFGNFRQSPKEYHIKVWPWNLSAWREGFLGQNNSTPHFHNNEITSFCKCNGFLVDQKSCEKNNLISGNVIG